MPSMRNTVLEATLEGRLLAAVAPHDLLAHPFYQAWSTGKLTLPDLALYAAQYQHQVEALPALLRAARDSSADAGTRACLERNLDQEEGRSGPAHADLWRKFGDAVSAQAAEAAPKTRESARALRELAAEGEVESLASLWSYERQTAHVAATKRIGLEAHYGVHEVAFFQLHEGLDVHHAAELLAAVERAARDEAAVARACAAAARSARAQWLFLDGVADQLGWLG